MLAVNLFSTLLIRLLPLYGLIGVGFLAGRYTAVPKERLAFLVLYLLAPVIVFNGVAVAPLTMNTVVLPLFFFGLCSVLCLVFYYIGTFVCGGGPRVAKMLTRMVVGEPLVNLELHGVDGGEVVPLRHLDQQIQVVYLQRLEWTLVVPGRRCG